MAKGKGKGRVSPDIASLAGVLLATGGIGGGLILEGGGIKDIAQYTAAVIVLGGTLGAVLIATPLAAIKDAAARLKDVFVGIEQPPEALIEEIIDYATKARKSGIVSLEDDVNQIKDPFLKKALTLAVDGTDLEEVRKIMELTMEVQEHKVHQAARVYEAAGGYAPTVGIIGALMGLIQVMKNLSDIENVGNGIAVAFVATIYGVALANIFFLPASNKIKARVAYDQQRCQLMLEGVIGIVEGLNPKLIRSKLDAFSHTEKTAPAKKRKPEKAAA